jgi:guanylate cyclase
MCTCPLLFHLSLHRVCSYPRIRPPSFYTTNESSNGLTLHYRSRRQGYLGYVMGQLIEIGTIFFNQQTSVMVGD